MLGIALVPNAPELAPLCMPHPAHPLQLADTQPDWIIVALCGLDEPTTVSELEGSLARDPAWWVAAWAACLLLSLDTAARAGVLDFCRAGGWVWEQRDAAAASHASTERHLKLARPPPACLRRCSCGCTTPTNLGSAGTSPSCCWTLHRHCSVVLASILQEGDAGRAGGACPDRQRQPYVQPVRVCIISNGMVGVLKHATVVCSACASSRAQLPPQLFLFDCRPGPRLVDALEFLVGLLNNKPQLIPAGFPWFYWRPSEQAAEK